MKIKTTLSAFAFLFFNINGSAQWSSNPSINTPISVAVNFQGNPESISDGSGGYIITWTDSRTGTGGTGYDIYAQRINSAGVPQWTLDGIVICSEPESQYIPKIVSDGAGGAIITWFDFRDGLSLSYDIYAQKVNSAGIIQWTASGVPISTFSGSQSNPEIVYDGLGGAIIVWSDSRGSNLDIYAQHINSSGVVLWATDGTPISTAVNDQNFPHIISDSSGGAIISWDDKRNGLNKDIYAQRVDGTGSVLWTVDGTAICSAINDQMNTVIITDNFGGALISWIDNRTGSYDVYAQSINSFGITQWTSNGIAVASLPSTELVCSIVSDGASGAIIVWKDFRSGTTSDIYAQYVNATGAMQWIANGISICNATETQNTARAISDCAGGAIITWSDYRSGSELDIYTQHINTAGVVQWVTNGIIVSNAIGNQDGPQIISDEMGGAMITWIDERSVTTPDIYAQNIWGDGFLTVEANLENKNISISPNPSSGFITIKSSMNMIQIQVINSSGSSIYETECNQSTSLIDLQTFSKGIYFIKITYENKKILNKKIVVQ